MKSNNYNTKILVQGCIKTVCILYVHLIVIVGIINVSLFLKAIAKDCLREDFGCKIFIYKRTKIQETCLIRNAMETIFCVGCTDKLDRFLHR